MNPQSVSSWTQNFDWVLFAGAAAWTLAAVAALMIGMPRPGAPRAASWLWVAGFYGAAALGMAAGLLRYYGWLNAQAQAALAAIPLIAAAALLGRLGKFPDGDRRGIAGLAIASLVAGGAAVAAGPSGQVEYVLRAEGRTLADSAAFLQCACALIACLWTHRRLFAAFPVMGEDRASRRHKTAIFALLVAAVSVAGIVVTELRCRSFLSDQEERSIWRVKTAALGLDLSAMLRLGGKPSDRRMPAFHVVTGQLRDIVAANADVLSAYLWTARSGRVVLLAQQDRGDRSSFRPGDAGVPGMGNAAAFTAGAPFLSLSIQQSPRAAVVSANQRINDPTDQSHHTPFAWLGLDFSARPWISGIAELRLQMIAGTYLAILLLAAGYGWISRLEIERNSEREKLALVEAERARFARDLHDGLGQTLSGLAWRAKALSNGLDGRSGGDASELAGMLAAAVGEARAIALAHAPPALQSGGLSGGLGWLAENTRKLFGVPCRLEISPQVPKFSDAAAHSVLQIAREAVHNGVRHGHANSIVIRLQPESEKWKLEIIDDGQGLSGAKPTASNLGLRMIAGRVRELGGSVEFLPCTPSGVRVTCVFPASRVLQRPS